MTSFDLDLLLHRLHVHKAPNWSRIGRLNRKQPAVKVKIVVVGVFVDVVDVVAVVDVVEVVGVVGGVDVRVVIDVGVVVCVVGGVDVGVIDVAGGFVDVVVRGGVELFIT